MGRRGKVGGLGLAVWVWWLVGGPVDFRCGADRLLVHVREVLEREMRWADTYGSAVAASRSG